MCGRQSQKEAKEKTALAPNSLVWGTEEAFLGHVVGTSPHSNVTSDLTVRVSHWDQSAVTAMDSGLGKVRSLTSVLQA